MKFAARAEEPVEPRPRVRSDIRVAAAFALALGGVEEQEVREVGQAAGDNPRVRGGHQLDRQRAVGWRPHWHRLEPECRARVHAVSIPDRVAATRR